VWHPQIAALARKYNAKQGGPPVHMIVADELLVQRT